MFIEMCFFLFHFYFFAFFVSHGLIHPTDDRNEISQHKKRVEFNKIILIFILGNPVHTAHMVTWAWHIYKLSIFAGPSVFVNCYFAYKYGRTAVKVPTSKAIHSHTYTHSPIFIIIYNT